MNLLAFGFLGASILGNLCLGYLILRHRREERLVSQAEELELSAIDMTLSGFEGMHLLLYPKVEATASLKEGDEVRLSEIVARDLDEVALSRGADRFLLDKRVENCRLKVERVTRLTKGCIYIAGKLELT